jgi:hypothetical protein
MKKLGVGLMMLLLFGGCSKQEEAESRKSSFTLGTGIQVISPIKCNQESARVDVDIAKTAPREYVLGFSSYLSCAGDLSESYLTVSKNGRSTLVVGTGSKDGCECSKSVSLKISNRLDSGEMVYVLAGGEVIGHVLVP